MPVVGETKKLLQIGEYMKVVLLLLGIASAFGIIKAIVAVFVPILFAFGYVVGLHDTPLTLVDCTTLVGGMTLFSVSFFILRVAVLLFQET